MPSAYNENRKDKAAAVREDIGGLMAELAGAARKPLSRGASCPVRNARPC